MKKKKPTKLEILRAKMYEFEVIHTPEFMASHLPKTGPFSNRFHLKKFALGTGNQTWECDYIHTLFPGYQKIEIKLTLKIIARSRSWKQFKITLESPPTLDEISKIRIQNDVYEDVKYELIHHLAKYF
jgi:hypothetical protein